MLSLLIRKSDREGGAACEFKLGAVGMIQVRVSSGWRASVAAQMYDGTWNFHPSYKATVACLVAVGSIMLPALVKQGYPKRFGAGVIATSGALGILFPPSINLVKRVPHVLKSVARLAISVRRSGDD